MERLPIFAFFVVAKIQLGMLFMSATDMISDMAKDTRRMSEHFLRSCFVWKQKNRRTSEVSHYILRDANTGETHVVKCPDCAVDSSLIE